jgi:hypothetical protein
MVKYRFFPFKKAFKQHIKDILQQIRYRVLPAALPVRVQAGVQQAAAQKQLHVQKSKFVSLQHRVLSDTAVFWFLDVDCGPYRLWHKLCVN